MTVASEPAAERGTALTRRDGWNLVWLLLLAAGIRIAYLVPADLPSFDPWRHLLLVDRIRSGAGFTLFEGQPYLWYSPVWYRLCAALPAWVPMDWAAGGFSLLCVPATYLLMRLRTGGGVRVAAVVAALLMAASGPLVEFTCHFGPEALALCLTLGALVLLHRRPMAWTGFVSGLLFGVALVSRLNFAFNLFLFWPALKNRRQGAALLGGTAIPLLLTWLRNHRIISSHPFVFTWDGLATRSADFDWYSTLVLQAHPALQEALRRLHEQVVPWPEWLTDPSGIQWWTILFMACGTLCVVAARRWELWLAVGPALGYFLLLDRSLSSQFFRIYLCVFPAFFLGVGLVAERLWRRGDRRWRASALALVTLALLGGASRLRPLPGPVLEAVTAPPSLLREQVYLVNSGRYHPSGLIYRYPEKRFLGLPLFAGQFEEFRRHHPDYSAVLWHDFSVQDELKRYLVEDGAYGVVRTGMNSDGRIYEVMTQSAD